jgi:hypothetical protein
MRKFSKSGFVVSKRLYGTGVIYITMYAKPANAGNS